MTLYYIESDFGYGDSSIIKSHMTEEEALEMFNYLTGGDFENFDNAYYYDHPIYDIREVGY
jgi:hypothetical protein